MSPKSFTPSFIVALALLFSACTDPASESGQDVITSVTTSTSQPDETAADATPSTTSDSATETTASSLTTSEPASSEGAGCPPGEEAKGSIIGVFEFVNMRAEPTVNSPVLAEVPARSEVSFFPDSFASDDDDRSFVAVRNGAESCGWVSAEYLADADGRLVGFIDGVTYVERALHNLGAQAAHATYTQDGAEAPEVPFDDRELDLALNELRSIGRANPGALVRPDAAVEPLEGSEDPVGCIFGDGLFCQVEVLNANGEVIVVVGIGWYGDGISFLDLSPPG